MRIKDYREALLAHFGITSLNELRANEQWKELSKKYDLTRLRTRSDWELAFAAISAVGQEAVSGEESIPSATDRPVDKDCLSLPRKDAQAPDIRDTDQATFHEMHNQEGNLVGALLEYSDEQSKSLIKHFQQLRLHSPNAWHQGNLSSSIIDQLGFSSSLVLSGLQAGKLFRVVGSPALVSQVSAGTAQLMQTSSGVLGTVTSSGQIIGQLRFAPMGLGSALPILAPIIAYQVLHAIVGTHQLNQINQRLTQIEKTLQGLYGRGEAGILGEIHGAVETLDDILNSRMHSGIFSSDCIARLASVEKTIRAILARNKILVDLFSEKAHSVKSSYGKQGARCAAKLLKSDAGEAIYDMQCLVGLIAAELKLEQVLLLLAMQENPADVNRRQERIRSKMQSHHELIESLPSVKAIEQHAQACIREMKWWERLCDGWQTYREVESIKSLELKDVQLKPNQLETGLSGYIFWRDDEGTHVFSVSGDDLQLLATENTDQSALDLKQFASEKDSLNQQVVELTVQAALSPGKTYKLRVPGISNLLEVFVEDELEPNLWTGYHQYNGSRTEVILRHRDYYKPSSTYKPNWTMPGNEPLKLLDFDVASVVNNENFWKFT